MANYVFPSGSQLSYRRPTPLLDPQLPDLESVVQQQAVLPAYSLILGRCDDNLPLVLDLTEPGAGSFLIAGDSGFANTQLLHSVITSGFLLNTEYEVNLHLISPQADTLTKFHRQANFKISYQPERPEVEIVLEEMAALIESRKQRGRNMPIHVLCIDGLDILWDRLSTQGKMWLKWLVTYGPRRGLWVFAALETEYLKPELYPVVDCFPSRLLGRIQRQNHTNYLAGIQRCGLKNLVPELEFVALTGGQTFNLWLLPASERP